MSKTKAAMLMGWSESTISRSERGEIRDIEKLAKLCSIYGASAAEVFFGPTPRGLADAIPQECVRFFIEIGEALKNNS